MLAAAVVMPVRADGECDAVDATLGVSSPLGAETFARASVSAPGSAPDPTASPSTSLECVGAPRVAVDPVLAPDPATDPCHSSAADADVHVRSPRGANFQVSQPVGPVCTVTSSVPGPLVLSVYWNGTNGWQIEWTFTGSFTCSEIAGDAQGWRIDCVPDDPSLYHCVNPGVKATHSGAEYTRTVVNLGCGSIYGGCETPFEVGSCVAWLGGDQIDTIECTGQYQIWVGSGSDNLPWRMDATCYSDPPQLPPGSVVVG